MTAGVYCIRNRETGAAYIGSSKTLYERLRTHTSALNAGRHRNDALQSDWSQVGRAGFSFTVLEVTDGDDVALIAAEERWISAEGENFRDIYNVRTAKVGRHSGARESRPPCQCGCKARMAALGVRARTV